MLGPGVNNAMQRIASPVLREAVVQGALGAGLGAIGGGLGASMNGGNFWQGAGQGAAMGFATGLFTGSLHGFQSARAQGVSPWTGKGPKPGLQPPTITSSNLNSRQVNADVEINSDQQIMDWYNEYARTYGQQPLNQMPPAGPGNGIGYSGVVPNQVKYQVQLYWDGGTNIGGWNLKVKTWSPPILPNGQWLYLRFKN